MSEGGQEREKAQHFSKFRIMMDGSILEGDVISNFRVHKAEEVYSPAGIESVREWLSELAPELGGECHDAASCKLDSRTCSYSAIRLMIIFVTVVEVVLLFIVTL